jgi:hypothetical protein
VWREIERDCADQLDAIRALRAERNAAYIAFAQSTRSNSSRIISTRTSPESLRSPVAGVIIELTLGTLVEEPRRAPYVQPIGFASVEPLSVDDPDDWECFGNMVDDQDRGAAASDQSDARDPA